MAETTPIEFEFKLVEPTNLERFSEMMDLCLAMKPDSNYYNWKYLNNPAGKVIAFEALHDGRPAAFYGVIPEIYRINGEAIRIYQSMDTMTHPAYQKRGLFGKLANMTYDYVLQTQGRCDLVGIPGGNSFYGFVHKLNWKNIHNFSYMFLPKALFRARDLIKKKGGAEVKEVADMAPELIRYLTEREPSPKPISNLFSPEFFQWRIFDNPYKKFKVLGIYDGSSLVGVCVYNLDAEGRYLIHLLDFAGAAHYQSYARAVMRFLFAAGAQVVYTWEPLNEVIRSAYQDCGFLTNRFAKGPFSYRIPFIVRSDGTEINGVDWFDIRNFDLQPIMQD